MMTHYRWSTENSHSNNTETMTDFIENHFPDELTFLFQDGSYAEAVNVLTGDRFAIHAAGDGDFNNHIVRFELL